MAEYSRYVIDLNRPADNQSLYPGQTTTGLVPTRCFDGSAIYENTFPTESDIHDRIAQIWKPYHDAIQAEIERLLKLHSIAVLIEAHSIRSVVPRLFEDVLPDFNIGTNHGKSCDAGLTQAVTDGSTHQRQYSHVVDGRFVGGYITRTYGRPADGVHAIQIELSQATYMDEDKLEWHSSRAVRVQEVIRQVLTQIRKWVQRQ